MTERETAERLLRAARAAGADQADVQLRGWLEFTAQVREGELELLKEAAGRGLSLRVFRQGRRATVSATGVAPGAEAEFAAEAVALADLAAPDDTHRLPESELYARELPDLDLDDRGAAPDTDARIALALATEAAALAADARIVSSQGASFSRVVSSGVYATSNGFLRESRGTSNSLSVMPVARDASGERVSESWGKSSRHFCDLAAPEEIGAEAARLALRRLDARPAPTGVFPVLFEPRAAASLLALLFGCLAGSAVWRRRSYLAERLGEMIAAESVTLIDAPHLPRGLGSRPCDGEGLPGSELRLVDGGRLRSFATDLESSRRLGLPATGHGGWGGGVSPSNLHLAPGGRSAGAITADTARGLLVTGLLGRGFRPGSGHWSQGCTGLWIEGGEIAYAVSETTIAGDLESILTGIDAIGDDLDFGLGAVCAPTIRTRALTVGGA